MAKATVCRHTNPQILSCSLIHTSDKVLKSVQCALCAQQMTQLKISNLIVTEELVLPSFVVTDGAEEPLLLGLKRLEHQD